MTYYCHIYAREAQKWSQVPLPRSKSLHLDLIELDSRIHFSELCSWPSSTVTIDTCTSHGNSCQFRDRHTIQMAPNVCITPRQATKLLLFFKCMKLLGGINYQLVLLNVTVRMLISTTSKDLAIGRAIAPLSGKTISKQLNLLIL